MTSKVSTAVAEREVSVFKEFLRIKTLHPKPDLESCVAWLKRQADSLKLHMKVFRYVQDRPVVVLSRIGSEPHLPSIGLNCHMDVVPVDADRWIALPEGEDPFSAYESPDGKIYARGSQDMKCSGCQYLSALGRLEDKQLRRTVHLVFVPDEEIGGAAGMKRFTTSKDFIDFNFACMIDEGLASADNKYVVFTGERSIMWLRLEAQGDVGHAAKLIPNTAVDRIGRAVGALTELRDRNIKKLADDPSLQLGDVTTFNITVLEGGKAVAPNVIPSNAALTCDIRIALQDYKSVVDSIKQIATEHNLKMKYLFFEEKEGPSPYSDRNGVWMRTIQKVLDTTGVPTEPSIFPAATDSRYVRRAGLPAFGFSPIRLTPSLLHDHNEYLSRAMFLEGCDVMSKLVENLASVPATTGKL